MKGVFNYSEETRPACKTNDDYGLIDKLGENYSIFAAGKSYSKCLGTFYDLKWRIFRLNFQGITFLSKIILFELLFSLAPCQTSAYDVGIDTSDRLSFVNINLPIEQVKKEIGNNANKNKSEVWIPRLIYIYYATTDVKVFTTSLKIDLNTFISNVGGNLGLFVGFSVLGGLSCIYNFIASHICKNV